MTAAPDAELLEQFARNDSEAAFAVLVERHIGLVHSVALRHTASPQHAQDITQAVFIILARKAGSLGRKTVLPGWLYHTARLTAANWQRAEMRRVRREQEAYMQSTLEETTPDAVWRELSPLLDDAMARLGAADRDAIVLRYFQNKSLLEVGAALGVEERAAQKRVSRALEKLRKIFSKRDIALSAVAISGAVSANSVSAAPVGLAKTISVMAFTKGAAAGGSTLALVKGALKLMAWTKAKTAIVIGIGVLLAAGTATEVVKRWQASQFKTVDVLLLKVKDPEKLRAHLVHDGQPGQFGMFKMSHSKITNGNPMQLAELLESKIKKPVLDQTGADAFYEFKTEAEFAPAVKGGDDVENWRIRIAQLGLELVPSREKIEMLVIERVK